MYKSAAYRPPSNTNVKCNPLHYNAIRVKPTYPQALIENNIITVKPFPNNWIRTFDEWKYFKQEKQFKKRCLFDASEQHKQIHLRSLDTLTNQHLLGPDIQFPHEDEVYQVLGSKAYVGDKRNGLPELAPGDKSYKAVEYSPLYYNKNTHSRDPIRRPKKKGDIEDFNILQTVRPSSKLSLKGELEFDSTEKKDKIEEIENVKGLDTWVSINPLKAPFKVLDLEEKAPKYKPKVSK